MNARATLEAAIAESTSRLTAKQLAAADLAESIRQEQANLTDLQAAIAGLPEPTELEPTA